MLQLEEETSLSTFPSFSRHRSGSYSLESRLRIRTRNWVTVGKEHSKRMTAIDCASSPLSTQVFKCCRFSRVLRFWSLDTEQPTTTIWWVQSYSCTFVSHYWPAASPIDLKDQNFVTRVNVFIQESQAWTSWSPGKQTGYKLAAASRGWWYRWEREDQCYTMLIISMEETTGRTRISRDVRPSSASYYYCQPRVRACGRSALLTSLVDCPAFQGKKKRNHTEGRRRFEGIDCSWFQFNTPCGVIATCIKNFHLSFIIVWALFSKVRADIYLTPSIMYFCRTQLIFASWGCG